MGKHIVGIKRINYDELVPIKFSIDTLDIIIAFIFSDSKFISRANLSSIQKLFDKIDKRLYESDFQLIGRFCFIRRALKLKLNKFIDNPKLLAEACRTEKYAEVDDIIISELDQFNLSFSEIKYVNSMISDKLNYSYIFKYKDDLIKILRRVDDGEYENFKDITENLKLEMVRMLTDIRRIEQDDDSTEKFSLTDGLFDRMVEKTVNRLKQKSTVLKTGIQELNNMFNGGLEGKRVYTIAGLTGGGKSTLALNLAYQVKQCNKNYKTKEDGKLPTILLLTHENTVEETIERLYALAAADSSFDFIKDHEADEIKYRLRNKGKLILTDENNIDIVVIYKKAFSINTADVYDIIDELEEEGREIILLIHDYLWKIHSVTPAKELRLELGYATDEFKALAVEKDIPVILLAQLNREAGAIIEDAKSNQRTDPGKLLTNKNLGESYKIVENSDVLIVIYRECINNNWFMSVKRLKIRYGTEDSTNFFVHPFNQSGFGLVIDYYDSKPISQKSSFAIASMAANDEENASPEEKESVIEKLQVPNRIEGTELANQIKQALLDQGITVGDSKTKQKNIIDEAIASTGVKCYSSNDIKESNNKLKKIIHIKKKKKKRRIIHIKKKKAA